MQSSTHGNNKDDDKDDEPDDNFLKNTSNVAVLILLGSDFSGRNFVTLIRSGIFRSVFYRSALSGVCRRLVCLLCMVILVVILLIRLRFILLPVLSFTLSRYFS